jgi:hypothetical protein
MSQPTPLMERLRQVREDYSWFNASQRRAHLRETIENQISPPRRHSRYEILGELNRENYQAIRRVCRGDLFLIIRAVRNGEDEDVVRDLLEALARHPTSYSRRQLRNWITERLENITDGAVRGCLCCSKAELESDLQSNSNGEHFCGYCVDNDDRVVTTTDGDEPALRSDCYAAADTRYEAVNDEPSIFVRSTRWLRDHNFIQTDNFGWVSSSAYTEMEEQGDFDSDSSCDDDDSEPNPPSSPTSNEIICYHNSRAYLGHLPGFYDNAEPRLLMGMELEIEVDNDDDCNEKARDVRFQLNGIDQYVKGVYCWTERDGSLERGFEVVTGYCGLDVHEEHLLNLKSTPGMRSHDTSTCGLHVHLDRSNITALHATKLVQFINNPSNSPFILAVARRRSDSYGKLTDKSDVAASVVAQRRSMWSRPHAEHYRNPDTINAVCGSRYEAVNFETEGNKTIEFRLFRGTLYVPTIMATLEFSRITYLFTRDTPLPLLNVEQFITYIQRPEHRLETRYLRQYLFKRGWTKIVCHANECAVPLAHQLERRFAA